jgi:hypothetical protein
MHATPLRSQGILSLLLCIKNGYITFAAAGSKARPDFRRGQGSRLA